MKKFILYTSIITAFVLVSVASLKAQPPHPGQQSGGSAVSGERIGNGAPIGNGTFVLFALALAYAGRKFYEQRRAAVKE